MGWFRSALAAVFLAAAAGCTGTKPAPAAPAAEPEHALPGGSLTRPIVRCGPRDSYTWVAREFRCSDGNNPFGGDVRAAARARSGAQQSPETGHPVDTYEVPCSDGPVTVYVDMYGCERYARLLAASPSAELEAVAARFDAGRYPEVVMSCEAIFERGEPLDVWSVCGTMEPAALVLLGDRRAIGIMRRTCAPMPPASPKSDARVNAVLLAIVTLARGSQRAGPEVNDEAAEQVLRAFAGACEIDPREVIRRLEAERA